MTKPTLLKPSQIRHDGGTQPRSKIDEDLIQEYREAYKDNEPMPPLDVFYDGVEYWLADGFHRLFAAIRADQGKVECNVHRGTQRDAILFSVGANASHGKRRSNADKRRAVTILLKDEEWSKMSDRTVADACKVGRDLVADVRESLPKKPQKTTQHTPSGDASQVSETTPETKPTGGEQAAPEKPPVKVESVEDDAPFDCTPVEPPKRTGKDGKSYPAQQSPKAAKKPKPKPGRATNDTRPIIELRSAIGKAIRLNTQAKDACGGVKHWEAIKQRFDFILLEIEGWLKETQDGEAEAA